MKYLLTPILLLLIANLKAQQTDFLVKPYLQIGKKPSPQSMQLLWHSTVSNDVWIAEYKNSTSNDWIKSENPTTSKIAVAGIDPFLVYSTSFTSLNPGGTFQYRVSKNGKVVFTAEAKALKTPEQSYRVAILVIWLQVPSNQAELQMGSIIQILIS
jgi:hypothetical protein